MQKIGKNTLFSIVFCFQGSQYLVEAPCLAITSSSLLGMLSMSFFKYSDLSILMIQSLLISLIL
jgi:hypothetical protein